jgi:aminocarboxymuconate-semialdehyde decarboxylase
VRIDVHSHFFPDAYLRLLEDRAEGVWVRTDRDGRRYLEEGGTRLATITRPMTVLEDRLAMMREHEIDVQVISLTSPNVYCFAEDDAIAAARLVNDEYAAIKDRHRGRFRCLASVPLGTGAEVEELDRAITELGLDGVIVGTNVHGRSLEDPAFAAFWRRADELALPVLLHPMTPMLGTAFMDDFALVPMLGFPFDTTLAVVRLMWTGFLDRHPRLKLIALHTGGALPYWRDGWRSAPTPTPSAGRSRTDRAGTSGVSTTTPSRITRPRSGCWWRRSGPDRSSSAPTTRT